MSFHLFHITEVYSNADGSVQFIELESESSGQQFWANHHLTVSQTGQTTHDFLITSNLPGDTPAGTKVLLATQGFADLGVVTPDYIIPNSFLFTGGGSTTVNWVSGDTLVYAALPTDGLHSLGADGTTQGVNSPKNFVGATGTVVLNAAPVASNPPADQYAGAGDPFELILPANTFTDADGDALTYVATLVNGDALPPWLSFVPGTRTFSGTPDSGDADVVSVKVSVSDGHSHTTSDVFNLTVVTGDVELGTGGDDSLAGSAGDDALVGGAGNDTYTFNSTGELIVEQAGQGAGDLVLASVTVASLAANVENLTLTGSGNLNATGNSGANVITGNTGDNVLDGGGGADTLMGGLGNDTFMVDSTTDAVSEGLDEGEDLVIASVTLPALAANVENLTLAGAGNLNATGNALANKLTGNDGNNILDGGAGADTMAGGAGNDIFLVDDQNDVVSDTAGFDRVTSSASFTLGAGIENLTLTGTAVGGTGNELNNAIAGNPAANVLSGAAGNDTLTGGAGADDFVFDQASGADRITDFVSGTDQLLLDNAVFAALLSEGALAPGSLQLALHRAISDTSGDNASDGLQDYLKYATDTGGLYYDANGTAAGGLQLIATLASSGCGASAHPTINLTTAQDIVVI